ncbi:MAG: UDP-N-acetylmuramoyl-L-alanyl-D-glutamate--2,6-diaminopimelate ligase [Deltaproteobacteria bacterium RBG_13_49_15]|nr:MAG: UDP-N-acetylmuramoyl-L-alanyl-D-glutamate--2,6-diaminopimelate ligase [Deltaproteobacteria bacterium RBG_13_49_15]
MKLSALIRGIEPIQFAGFKDQDPEIESVHYRAQDVGPDSLFVAMPGHSADGHDYIEMAVNQGAAVVISQHPISSGIGCVIVSDSRKALAVISGNFYGNPSEHLTVVGITGTNGKTTTAFLIENMIKEAGHEVGLIGTILCRFGDQTLKTGMTTPESLDLQRILARMAKCGVTHVVMEVSSHALCLSRVDHCWMDIGVFTNLSRDHLDFHKDMESYWECKKLLFTQILKSGPKKGRTVPVLNCNDEKGKELYMLYPDASVRVGTDPGNPVHARMIKSDMNGIKAALVTPSGDFDIASLLVGAHNLENILCAVGTGIALKLPIHIIQSGIETLAGVPGRFEKVPDNAGRHVIVDYAHTPAAMEHILATIRSMASGRLICIFGCGGERDREKRPQMGEIAGRLCDLVIVTSDNPRREDPLEIIAEIEQGVVRSCPKRIGSLNPDKWNGDQGYVIEPDRRRGISMGIAVSRPGDTVLIAGKGHEPYQIIGQQTFPFDDRVEAKKALSGETD